MILFLLNRSIYFDIRKRPPKRTLILLNDLDVFSFQKLIEHHQFQKEHTVIVDNYDDFKEAIKMRRGFVLAHWDGTTETELKIKEDTQATIRCIPNDEPHQLI